MADVEVDATALEAGRSDTAPSVFPRYDERYFSYQVHMGRFGGIADAWKFQTYLRPSDRVMDFGCGGGFMLRNLDCGTRLGVEVNEVARRSCEALGIPAVATLDEVPDEWADVVISHHALEHTTHPLSVLLALRNKCRPDGKVVIVVPCESIGTGYVRNDPNQHLYTWSPLNLGNLGVASGLRVIECRRLLNRWPPKPMLFQRLFGWKVFHAACWVRGFLFRRLSQVVLVAERVETASDPLTALRTL